MRIHIEGSLNCDVNMPEDSTVHDLRLRIEEIFDIPPYEQYYTNAETQMSLHPRDAIFESDTRHPDWTPLSQHQHGEEMYLMFQRVTEYPKITLICATDQSTECLYLDFRRHTVEISAQQLQMLCRRRFGGMIKLHRTSGVAIAPEDIITTPATLIWKHDHVDMLHMLTLTFIVQEWKSSRPTCRMESLLKLGVNVNAVYKSGRTLLALLCSSIQYYREDILDKLLEYDMDVNFMNPLFTAITSRSRAAYWLIRNGANPNQIHDCGRTCLHAATLLGNIPMVHALLAAGANPFQLGDSRQTCLHDAVVCDSIFLTQLFLNIGVSPNLETVSGIACLHYALNPKMQSLLESHGATCTMMSLEDAIVQKHYPSLIVQARNTPPDVLFRHLPLAFQHFSVKIFHYVLKYIRGCEEMLLNDRSPYHWAIEYDHRAIAMLYEQSYHIELRDSTGHTPVECAVKAGHRPAVIALLKCGAVFQDTTMKFDIQTMSDILAHMPCDKINAFIENQYYLTKETHEGECQICTAETSPLIYCKTCGASHMCRTCTARLFVEGLKADQPALPPCPFCRTVLKTY